MRYAIMMGKKRAPIEVEAERMQVVEAGRVLFDGSGNIVVVAPAWALVMALDVEEKS